MGAPADAVQLRDWLIGILVERLGGEVMITAEEIEAFEGAEMMLWQDLPSLAYRIRVKPRLVVVAGEVVHDQRTIGS